MGLFISIMITVNQTFIYACEKFSLGLRELGRDTNKFLVANQSSNVSGVSFF